MIRYSVLLSLWRPSEKIRLDAIINKKKKKSLLLKLKYYPVLYHRPDIFHLQWAKSIEDWMWIQEFGMKLVVSLRGAHINYSPVADDVLAETYRTCFPKVDGFHAVSKAMAKEAMRYNADKAKIKVIYSGLEMNNLKFRKKELIKNKPFRIISVGRAHWIKGYAHALKSIYLLKTKGITLHYTIIGIEPNEELLYLRSSYGLDTEVSFIKTLSFPDVLLAIGNSDALLLSSLKEGIANVVLESMAVGTLVVSTDCGGMKEVITNGENGFLVPIRDSYAMAEALRKVSELSADEYDRMVINARRKIEDRHNMDSMTSGMRSLYFDVLNDKL